VAQTTLALLGIGYQQTQNWIINDLHGLSTPHQVQLHLRLNCPWRAAASAAMVRSAMSVPAAAIGVIQLAARVLAASASIAAMPTCTPTAEPADTLCVALRIDTLIYLIDLTLYPAIPLGWQDL
jgi:hypothetical protein